MNYGDKFYYSNETSDDVVDFKITPIKIDKNYKYVHKNIFYRLWSFLTYRLIATPIAWCHYKLFKRTKFINKKVLKLAKKNGFFVYANHTQQFGDAFCPTLICFPKKPGVVVNPANVSNGLIGKLTRMWGALPLPDTLDATKNFYSAIEHTLNQNNPVVIYPEAHLWPYYTKIRPFSNLSFRYPVKYDKPVFTFTTVYKLKKLGKKPKVEIHIDGPFFVDKTLPTKEAQEKLRNDCYNAMVERSKLSDYEYVTYERRTND